MQCPLAVAVFLSLFLSIFHILHHFTVAVGGEGEKWVEVKGTFSDTIICLSKH